MENKTKRILDALRRDGYLDAAQKLAELDQKLDALQAENRELQKRLDTVNNFEQSQCAKLLAKISRMEAERDAAIEDIEMDCRNCLHQGERYTVCKSCEHCDAWDWRGAQGEV